MDVFPKPEEIFEPLCGNEALKSYLSASIRNGRLSHAYIIEGVAGSGKFTLATMLSAALAPQFSEKIMAGGCVDVNVYSLPEDKKSIGIATVRELKYRAFIQPQELPCQIFIVRDAHTLTAEAQNSLLKILEEPPKGVYIFLLCENASLLLPTVRSRAPSLKMQSFTEEELGLLLPQLDKKAGELSKRSPEDYSLLLRSASGSIGKALAGLSRRKDSKSALREKAATVIGHLREGKATELLLFFATQGLQRDDMLTLLCYLREASRDMLAVKKCEEPRLLFYLSREAADEDAYSFAAESLLKIYNISDSMAEELSANPNMNVFSIKCACALSEAAT
ncbi:MAG: hypothetical protein IKB34_03395 [Clostridia bacterium]|nr:hypothetical protein [Clostridia bacterium]